MTNKSTESLGFPSIIAHDWNGRMAGLRSIYLVCELAHHGVGSNAKIVVAEKPAVLWTGNYMGFPKPLPVVLILNGLRTGFSGSPARKVV